MNVYRYILEPYTGRNSRYTCPGCEKPFEFAKYIDSETGEVLADNVGKCNRVDKCGYHYTPKQYFADNGIKPEGVEVYIPKPQPSPRPVSYIETDVFNKSLNGFDKNNLVKYLHSLFDADTVNQLINKYKIGTSKRYEGGTTIFWQVDASGKVRTGKLIKYDNTGHRIHGKQNWVHSVLELNNFNLKQCFFGEHLLKENPGATIGIVESEKTAIIAAAKFPGLIWLASGGAEGINKEKVKPLIGREVILFPDASINGKIFKKWKQKADMFGFECSDYLETKTNDEQKAKGVDIADFISDAPKQLITDKKEFLNKVTDQQTIDLVKHLYSHPMENILRESENMPVGLVDNIEMAEIGAALLPDTVWIVKSQVPDELLKGRNIVYGSKPVNDKYTPQISYNTPSPVAIIDSKIENPPKFKGLDLVIKNRIFTSTNGDKIELVGFRDYGYCGNWKKHKEANGYCKPCLLNCLHTIKVNGELKTREYSQLEVLLMQDNQ